MTNFHGTFQMVAPFFVAILFAVYLGLYCMIVKIIEFYTIYIKACHSYFILYLTGRSNGMLFIPETRGFVTNVYRVFSFPLLKCS